MCLSIALCTKSALKYTSDLMYKHIGEIDLKNKIEQYNNNMASDVFYFIGVKCMYLTLKGKTLFCICNMNAFFSFDLFMVYILECKQQIITMK